MASLAKPMAELWRMPGNWFQQDFLGRYVRTEIAKALSSLCLLQQEPALSESKLALYQKVLCLFGNLFSSLAISFQRGILFILTLHIPPLLLKPVTLYTWGQKQLEIGGSSHSHTALLLRYKTQKRRATWLNCSIADYSLENNFNANRRLIAHTQIYIHVHTNTHSWRSYYL